MGNNQYIKIKNRIAELKYTIKDANEELIYMEKWLSDLEKLGDKQ